MHTGMAIRFTCDANQDFVRGMVRPCSWICFLAESAFLPVLHPALVPTVAAHI
jgi:hypothetical protein